MEKPLPERKTRKQAGKYQDVRIKEINIDIL